MSWEKFSEKVTHFNGSVQFCAGFSVAAVLGIVLGALGVDKDFALMTVALSVLAIYLPIFIQNSQNRSQKRLEDLAEEINTKLDAIVKHSKGIHKE